MSVKTLVFETSASTNSAIEAYLKFEIDLKRTGCEITIFYHPSNHPNISGATMLASLSTINLGVSMPSFPHVIFSFGTAPLYDPKLVVLSLIWQK